MTAVRVISEHSELLGSGVVSHEQLDELAGSMLVVVSGSYGNARQLVQGPGVQLIDTGRELIVSAIQAIQTKQSWLEVPTGDNDGMNKIFTLQFEPNPQPALMFFMNGLLLKQGDDSDYVLSGSNVVLTHAFRSGSNICASYPY